MANVGRKPNKIRLYPSDLLRTKAWIRVVKQIVLSDTDTYKANAGKICAGLYSQFGVMVTPDQLREWWKGNQIPQPRTRAKFSKSTTLSKTLNWLEQFPHGNPIQRHFVAIDALVDAYSIDPIIRQRGLDAADKVITALDDWWAPKEFPGHTSYIMKVSQSEYMHEGETDPFANKWEQGISGYRDKELLLTLTRIYNPFDSTSVAQFLLVLGLFGLQSEKLLRHWVLDFVSASYALYTIMLVKDIAPPMWEPTDAGKIAQVALDFFEKEGINVESLIHQSRRYPFTFRPDIMSICELLSKTHAAYAHQLTEVDIDVTEIKTLVQAAAFSDARIAETRRMVEHTAKVLLGENYAKMND